MTCSLTTALEEMTINNEQLRRENDVIKTDNTQLRTNNDAMKDEITQQRDKIGQLTTVLDSKRSEIVQLRMENQQLKVSQWSGITSHSHTTPNIHTLRT